jgi:acetylornithine deacetylase/succinyl-diaminopimelate desuccinylase-like protein
MLTPEEFAEAQRARFEEGLSDLLRIPSIRTLPAPGRPMHSPDEKLDLVHFHNGVHAVMRFWERLATT